MSLFSSLIGPIVGGLLGSQGESKKESTTIDPRLGRYVYGDDGKGGLLGEFMMPIFRQQYAQGGLNDMQRGGLEMQRQYLMSPQYTQGYGAMQSMGLGLMGAGVARNPFNSGVMGGGMGGMQPQPMGRSMGGNPTAEIQRQFNALSTGGGGQAALDDWFRSTPYSPEQINAAFPQYAASDLAREMSRARGPVRPTTDMNYSPFQYQQNPAMAALSMPIQSVAQYQAANPMPTPQEDANAAIDDYLKAIGFDGFGEGGNTNSGGFDGGFLGGFGGGNAAGNNSGNGLGSAMGGSGVDMGSAAGNAGDNSAEGATGDAGASGDAGDAGGADGDGSGDGSGYAKGGKVTKKRLKGPNPKGPDDGYAALDDGEYVINARSAKRIGYDKLHKMNKR